MRSVRSSFLLKYAILILFISLISATHSNATHLRAGEIIVERVNCLGLTFRITIIVYTNTGSTVLFGGRDGDEDILDFGDGSQPILVPEQANILRSDLGSNIGTASFTVLYTYSSPGKYTISYREPNRNEGVLNMFNSVNTRFYLETQINIDPFLGCNSTPRLLVPPIDQACPGVAFFHSPGAFDPDGDSLSYELVVPFSDRDQPVLRYQDPSDNEPEVFYPDYNTGNEAGTGPPDFTIDPISGILKWDSPGEAGIGEYNIAFVVREWREILGEWVPLGFVRRDMQIIVADCEDNDRPDLIIPEDVCVVAGTVLEATIFGIDPDNDSVKIEAYSGVFDLYGATYTPSPPVYQSATAALPSPAELHFTWQTACDHVKEQPYQVIFKITDDPASGPRLVTFKTWNITVVGPPPVWKNAALNLPARTASLSWESYECTNAETMQVWRRVDSFPYQPDTCETGMPPFLGYQLIATLPLSDSIYTDNNNGKGLAYGAQYCYRLVAIFPEPKGGESLMSEEICLDPVPAVVPVITHVTIDRTSTDDGQITVRWREPFDADPLQYPPPYRYKIYRGEGFSGPQGEQPIHTGEITALEWIDNLINTQDIIYNYRIDCYDDNNVLMGSSEPASSVRLEAQSQLQRIDLTWSDSVPWSNQVDSFSMHLIYRGPLGATDDELELIDSVDVTMYGLSYSDEGQYNGVPLQNDQTYCYRVMTRGAYGNPEIDEPLENFSQMICAQPSDTIPPCQVAVPVAVNATDCTKPEEVYLLCSAEVFSNEFEWERPSEGDCQNDIAYYRIYIASDAGREFFFFRETRATRFVDDTQTSNAMCYKVSAVDRSGNEGELSEAVCFDNCISYELPNVFTPNGDQCNDLFSAYSNRPIQTTEGKTPPCNLSLLPDDRGKCARFVENVNFKVYNRWGKEVYAYKSGGERTIYIDWDGRDNEGTELATGVYYYMADVTFTTSDPDKRNQIFKGWVHLLR